MNDKDFIFPRFSLLQYFEANQYAEIEDEVATNEVWPHSTSQILTIQLLFYWL